VIKCGVVGIVWGWAVLGLERSGSYNLDVVVSEIRTRRTQERTCHARAKYLLLVLFLSILLWSVSCDLVPLLCVPLAVRRFA